MQATIVTAYFRLNKSKASPEKYNAWMSNMLANPNPMVIFCDEASREFIAEQRAPFPSATLIVVTSFKEFYSYQYAMSFVKHYEKDREQHVGHSALLYMIWSEKSHFLKRAIEMDPFRTHYFLWVDIGCFRNAPQTQQWPNPIRVADQDIKKVLLLSVQPFTSAELTCTDVYDLPLFQFVNRIGGTMFGGGKTALLRWHDLYYSMLRHFVMIDRFIGKDQSIMNSVYLLNRDLCHLITWRQGCADPWFYIQDYLR
jgi:hypothetical protein